jgi:hypothetical protein
MKRNIVLAVGLLTAAIAVAQQRAAPTATTAAVSKPAAAVSITHRLADGHPDLSGLWTFAISIPPGAVGKTVNGQKTVLKADQSARYLQADLPGAVPWTKEPSYKSELRAKVADLAAHESKVDAVFYCGRAGVPRIGSPRRIVQLPNELIFFYEEISGDVFRFIPVGPTNVVKHRADANPSYYGDAVAHWEGDTLVVDTTNFVDETWFGEDGYFHSDAMRVTERLWRAGDNLAYQVTVDDPNVLTQPWTNYAHLIKPSDEPMQESPACKDQDGDRLLNLDHHVQR